MNGDSRVYLDPFLIDRLRLNGGYSIKGLATAAGLAFNTLRAASLGEGVQPATAAVIARQLECKVTDLLSPTDPRYVAPVDLPGPFGGASEWETTSYLEQGRLAANGLYYIVCRMQHRHTAGRTARGKFYHLSWLPTSKQTGMRDHLSRHADVCVRVGSHRNIASNLTSTPSVQKAGRWPPIVD
jgi:hypothetical protein